jgi:hypothetical protein
MDENFEDKDIKIINLLKNRPSEPIQIENSKTRLVFEAPGFTDKYRGRAWASKKLKEIGIEFEDDQDLAYYFRYWGTLNTYVTKVYFEDKNGNIKLDGKKYSEFLYDPKTDLDYKSVFEKYVLEEMYPRGLDESFVTTAIISHMNWVKDRTMEEVDIKND